MSTQQQKMHMTRQTGILSSLLCSLVKTTKTNKHFFKHTSAPLDGVKTFMVPVSSLSSSSETEIKRTVSETNYKKRLSDHTHNFSTYRAKNCEMPTERHLIRACHLLNYAYGLGYCSAFHKFDTTGLR